MVRLRRKELLCARLLEILSSESSARLADAAAHEATFEMEVTAAGAVGDAGGSCRGPRPIGREIKERTNGKAPFGKRRRKAIGRRAGGVTHDFTNLLSAFLITVGLYRSLMGSHDPAHPGLDDSAGAGWRAAELRRQLLIFSRRQAPPPRRWNSALPSGCQPNAEKPQRRGYPSNNRP